MTATIKYISTVESKLSQLPIENGQLIFINDTRKIFLDFNDIRTEYSQIMVLQNEEHRKNILSPVTGFYFILSTCTLWRYQNGEWIQITTPPKENIAFLDYSDLPKQGKEEVLYVTKDQSYRWNGDGYTKLGNLIWEEF